MPRKPSKADYELAEHLLHSVCSTARYRINRCVEGLPVSLLHWVNYVHQPMLDCVSAAEEIWLEPFAEEIAQYRRDAKKKAKKGRKQ